MDNLMEKIGELLSDEESMKQISELAQMFMSSVPGESNENADSKEEAGESSEKSSESGGIFDNFDFSMLTKLQDIMGAVSQKDKNTDLLLALKPHLKEERQQKIDKAIKIMKLLAIWKVLKDSGMLKDFL